MIRDKTSNQLKEREGQESRCIRLPYRIALLLVNFMILVVLLKRNNTNTENAHMISVQVAVKIKVKDE
jgi:hypothetical protein